MRISTVLLVGAVIISAAMNVMLSVEMKQASETAGKAIKLTQMATETARKATIENGQNIKRLNRCVQQTDASGIDANGNLVFDREAYKKREAALKVKP